MTRQSSPGLLAARLPAAVVGSRVGRVARGAQAVLGTLLLGMMLASVISGCEDEFMNPAASTTKPKPSMRPARDLVDLSGLQTIDLEFRLRANGMPFDCDTDAVELGSAATAVRLMDARLFISELSLRDTDGKEQNVVLQPDDAYQQSKVALLDFEDASAQCLDGDPDMHSVLHVAVPEGTYRGLTFTVGVPEALNHADPLVAWPPLDRLAMHWAWVDGYRFLRVEVMRQDDVPLSVHLGSVDCDVTDKATTCDRSNRPAVELAEFDPETDAVAVDLSALFEGSDLTMDSAGCVAGASDDTVCAPIFAALGLDADSGSADAARQAVFSSEPR